MPSTAWCESGLDGVQFIVANTDLQALKQNAAHDQAADRVEAHERARLRVPIRTSADRRRSRTPIRFFRRSTAPT